jgi:hypothetical protein
VLALCLPILSTAVVAEDCGHLQDTATELAGSMETFRLLPEGVALGSETIDPAGFLHLAVKCIDAIDEGNPALVLPPIPDPLQPPGNPYPKIDLDDGFYSGPFTKEEYLAFFREIDADYGGANHLPQAFDVDGTTARVRYVEAVYYAAGVLRYVEFFGELPAVWDKYVIAPKGLVPWKTPEGYEEYTSALTSSGFNPFFPNAPRRYYARSPHEYDMFKLAMSIIDDEKIAFDAGRRIYGWVIAQWLNVISYSSGTVQHGHDQSGWERSHWYYHTSGPPRRMMSALLRAVGIPSSPGVAFFEREGWVAVENHVGYGSDPLDNPFYHDGVPPPLRNMPFPSTSHDFVQGIKWTRAWPTTPYSPDEARTLSINARDVLDYGPDSVLEHAGDFDILSVRVKTPKGYFYYEAPGFEDRQLGDALTPLVAAAHARGKKVYATFSTLTDSLTAKSTPEWKQMLNEIVSRGEIFPNIHVSPCVDAYKTQLQTALRALVENHDIDGVVLDHHYYTAGFGTGDTVGNPACPTGTDWMSGVVTSHAADLIGEIRAADPDVEVVVASFPLGFENRYFGLGPEVIGYQDLAALSAISDRMVLDFTGTYWVPVFAPYFLTAITDFQAITGEDPTVSFNLVDEWEYTPDFYAGLLRKVRTYGISGFDLHTALSAGGDLAPAFTRSSWGKVAAIEAVD